MTEAVSLPNRSTYRDYCGWDGRWELIDGTPYDMSPAPSRTHQEIVLALAVQLHPFFRQTPCRLYIAPFDVRLADGDEPDDDIPTVVQPDLAIICDARKLDDRGCRGAPDWIIEVLSPSTAARDQIDKRRLYERHGVRAYWLVHPYDHIVMRYQLQDDGGYGAADIREMRGHQEDTPFEGLTIDWEQILERDEPSAGGDVTGAAGEGG